jgi:hypothetical protein
VKEQLSQLQFRNLRIIGTQYESNAYRERLWQGETVAIEVADAMLPTLKGEMEKKRALFIDGQLVGALDPQRAQLPAGTRCQAKLTTNPSTSVVVRVGGQEVGC